MVKLLLASTLAIALVPIAAAADPCSDLFAMYKQMGAATSYRETKVSPGAPTIKTEFVAPDRTHTFLDTHESISIGKQHWDKLLGHWIEGRQFSEKSMSETWRGFAEDPKLMQNCRESDAKDLGIVDGSHVIHIDVPKYGVQVVMYLRADLLPVKIETTTRGKTYVTTYTDWNAPITIDAPQ